MLVSGENPFAPPEATVLQTSSFSTADETTRRTHLSHEANLRSIGLLYLTFSLFFLPFGVAGFAGGLFVKFVRLGLFELLILSVASLLGAGLWALGRAIRGLERWSRTPAIILSSFGLLGFPVGTLLNAYFLYLLLSPKGALILSPAYQAIVRRTPHIQYRTPWPVVVAIVVLVALMLAALVAGISA